jgi:hypothetical protein
LKEYGKNGLQKQKILIINDLKMQNIIEKYSIKAKKSLGQNFLMDEKILNRISSITNIS